MDKKLLKIDLILGIISALGIMYLIDNGMLLYKSYENGLIVVLRW